MPVALRLVVGALLGAALPLLLIGLGKFGFPMTMGYLGFCLAYGALFWALGVYRFRPLSLLGFFLDITWSLLNTVTGLVWLLICLARGSGQTVSQDTQRSGTLVIAGAALPGASASTLGNVIGGQWAAHEETHVWQARIFGPFYWLVYLLSYFTALIALMVQGRFSGLHWEAYGRVCMEDWGYDADPAFGGPIQWGGWLLGLLLATLNLVFLLLILHAVPQLRAFSPYSDAALVTVVIGIAGALLYALARSFFKAKG